MAMGNSEQAALFAEERRRAIMGKLSTSGKVTVEELAAAFSVSLPTARADLARLEKQGLLRRTHGGAIATSPTLFEPPYAQRQVMRHAEKRAIARVAAEIVQEGETILLDAGTTIYELALALRVKRSLTVVTNSLANAAALMESPGIEVILVGGVIQPRRRATLGPLAVQFIESVHVDRAFLAFSGVHPDRGFTVVDFDAAELKRRMMERAADSVALADSSKLGQVAFARVAPANATSLLITDTGISESMRSALAEQGLRIRIAPPLG